MKTYKLTFKIKSPIMTPLMADTLWGIVCWGIKYFEGEKVLGEFLDAYNSGSPPLILSDPFPSGYLPVPNLTPITKETMTKAEYKNVKGFKKIKFINSEYFFNKIPITHNILAQYLDDDIATEKDVKNHVRLHNVIERLTNTVKENGLYEKSELWFKENSIFDIYILSEFSKDKIVQLFSNAFSIGYGADTSVGKGQLEFVSIDENLKFPQFPDAKVRAMALASFIPSQDDKIKEVLYSLKTKYGKLGGEFAVKGNPFKKPLLMYETGSTFFADSNLNYVGLLITNVHSSYSFVKHYAYAPVIYFKEGDRDVV